jgi:hypothetical protein
MFAANPDVKRTEPVLHPYLALLQVGFAKRRVATDTRELLPHVFTIAGSLRNVGCVFSVALSVGFPRLAVSQHLALRSPDFPHSRFPESCCDPAIPLTRLVQPAPLSKTVIPIKVRF